MKLSDIALLASCAALALSQPLEKRVLVVETVYEQVIETVDVTTTYYVQPAGHAPSPSVTPSSSPSFKLRHKHKHTRKRSTTPKQSPIETVKPELQPVIIPEVLPSITPEVQPSITPEVQPSITPEVQPSITPEVQPVVTPEVKPVIAPEASSAPPVQTPPSAAPQEKYEYSYSFDDQVPAPSSTAIEAPPPPSVTPKVEEPPASASGGGACGTVGGKCVGDLTFYEAGLGACGTYNDGNSEAVFALAHGMPKSVLFAL